ncbi:MAG: DUF5703 domain-containing protein [Candidatus Sumerlaeota bacterium]|nr:DUF5703 domain-containing protein [Candidatus Sumerlaeota bacterium]
MRAVIYFMMLAPIAASLALQSSGVKAQDDLQTYNVVWKSPSADASGSMPIGNGEVGLNVWVEEGGDLQFYIARTDSWSECSRLLKLGKIRVSLSPNPFLKGAPFKQELILREGVIAITAGTPESAVELRVWVDASAPVIYVTGESAAPLAVTARLDCWRTERRAITGGEANSAWTMHGAPAEAAPLMAESPDAIEDNPAGAIVWYHRDESSIWELTMKTQGLESVMMKFKDPILNRTFGGVMTATGLAKKDKTTLASAQPVKSFTLRIATHTAQTATAKEWNGQAEAVAGKAPDAAASAQSTAQWWNEFWNRSWIYVEGDRAGGPAANGMPSNKHPLRLGADSAGGNLFRGLMARAGVYERALDAKEIEALVAADKDKASPVKEGLVACWAPGQAKDGAIANAAGAGFGARATGAVAQTQDAGVAAARFSGGYIETPHDARLNLAKGFTLEAWIKPEAAPAGGARIFDKITPGGSDGYLFDTFPSAGLRLIVGDKILTAEKALTVGQWTHVAATCDAGSGARRMYANGKLLREDGGTASVADTPSPVTRAYVLQRWMTACAGRGAFPIKFNGSIFCVEPKFTNGQPFNADYRQWGDCYWWQNTRLPYAPMLARGDFEMTAPLFKLCLDAIPVAKERSRIYYQCEGVYYPETMTFYGLYSNGDYGWNRKGKQPGDVACGYWKWAWNQGPELLMLMLDYYDYTQDRKFAQEQLAPAAREVLKYFDKRFPRDAKGKLLTTPTQAVETYWFSVTNDTPSVAGLNAVLARLVALPPDLMPPDQMAAWKRLRAECPPTPTRTENGKSFILPAQWYDPKRSNCETPEFFAIYPFRLYGVGKPDLETARETYRRRIEKAVQGWQYAGMTAALCGLGDECRDIILKNARNSHARHRFPAMWGPNYDWLPDQCHGSNFMNTLQLMVLQADGGKIYPLPAWPKEWNVRFKLHAPQRTTVEGVFRNGKMESLKVEPKERAGDVVQ